MQAIRRVGANLDLDLISGSPKKPCKCGEVSMNEHCVRHFKVSKAINTSANLPIKGLTYSRYLLGVLLTKPSLKNEVFYKTNLQK